MSVKVTSSTMGNLKKLTMKKRISKFVLTTEHIVKVCSKTWMPKYSTTKERIDITLNHF